MPPKKKEEEKKVPLGRPGNNLKSGIVCSAPDQTDSAKWRLEIAANLGRLASLMSENPHFSRQSQSPH